MIKIVFNKIILVNLLAMATINVAWAQSAPPFSTELGFKRLSDPSTPASLKVASNSVFEVRSISEDNVADLRTLDLTDPKFANFDDKIDSISELDANEKVVVKKQIENCRRHGNEKECTVFFGIEKGTAFLAGGDGSALWTNAHLVSRFLKLRAALAQKTVQEILKSDARVAIFLFDQNGNLVFDPFIDSAFVKIYPEKTSFAAALRGDWYSEDSDFVGIQLGRVVGTPLRIGAAANNGETLYRPGFAACTGCSQNPNQTDPELNRDRGPSLNSDGNGLYWTRGVSQGNDSVTAFLGVNLGGLFDLKHMVFFSADSQVGFSGGPILNNQGEVVGVFAGSKPKIYNKMMTVLSRGVRPPFFDNK